MSAQEAAAAEYPEHDKLHAVSDTSQAIGEFLDLGRWTLCEFVEAGDNGEPVYVWAEEQRTERGRTRRADGQEPENMDEWNRDAIFNPARESWGAHYRPVHDIQAVLAEYFDIDRDRLELEKRAMLDALRAKT